MKKNINRWWISIAVIFVAYNVIAWVMPVPKTAVFYVSYIFTLSAILAQIYVVKIAFDGEDKSIKSKFYGFPIAKIGIIYAVVQLILGIIFMIAGKVLPIWVVVIVSVILLVVFVIGTISADAVREVVEQQDVKIVKDTTKMKYLQSLAEVLPGRVSDETLVKELKGLYEALRYSDPVSSEATENIEKELEDNIMALKNALVENNSETTLMLCAKAKRTLEDRNIICQRSKKH